MQWIKSKLYISNIVDTIGNKMQDIYQAIVLQTSWNFFSKLEDKKQSFSDVIPLPTLIES